MSDPQLPDLPCYLNGEFTTLPNAKVSVMDRGFIIGDGIYEVVPAYTGTPYRFDEHMARLERSLGELRIPNPHSRTERRGIVGVLIERYASHERKPAGETNQLVYLQVTRGVAMRDHLMIPGLQPTVFATSNRLHIYGSDERAKGFACVSADDFRWKITHIKSTSLASAVLARQMSADVGAIETIMFRDGMLSEAAASSVWVVKGGCVLGPPKDNLVLEGIRYGVIEQLCREAAVPFELRRVSREEVRSADEILLGTATKEVIAVTQLD